MCVLHALSACGVLKGGNVRDAAGIRMPSAIDVVDLARQASRFLPLNVAAQRPIA